MRHVYRCPTRWADLDLLGHVNNVVYVDYLQEARVDLVRTMLGRVATTWPRAWSSSATRSPTWRR